MQNNVKSSSVAGVLGVFLGAFGGHDWYLNNTKKAITHVCLCVGGIILLMIGIILMSLLRDMPALSALSICIIVLAYVIIVGNLIWGFIEGVIILAQGDAGLAAKGYQVAVPNIYDGTNNIQPAVPAAANSVDNNNSSPATPESDNSHSTTASTASEPVATAPETAQLSTPSPAMQNPASQDSTSAATSISTPTSTTISSTAADPTPAAPSENTNISQQNVTSNPASVSDPTPTSTQQIPSAAEPQTSNPSASASITPAATPAPASNPASPADSSAVQQ